VVTPEPPAAQKEEKKMESVMEKVALNPDVPRNSLTDAKAQLAKDVMVELWARGRQFTNIYIADLVGKAAGAMLNTLAIGYIRSKLDIPYGLASHSLVKRWAAEGKGSAAEPGMRIETEEEREERTERARGFPRGGLHIEAFTRGRWKEIVTAMNEGTFTLDEVAQGAMDTYRKYKNTGGVTRVVATPPPKPKLVPVAPPKPGAVARVTAGLEAGRLPATFLAALELLKEAGVKDKVSATLKVHPDGKIEVLEYEVVTKGGGFTL
jgi:hypothetical protein